MGTLNTLLKVSGRRPFDEADMEIVTPILRDLFAAHSEQGWVSRLVKAADAVQLSAEAARHDSCTDTKNCPFAEFREALVAYKANLPAPPVHPESAQEVTNG